MLKLALIVVYALVSLKSYGAAAGTVFECKSSVQIDATETVEVSMTVQQTGSDYVALYTGAAQPGPLATTKQVMSLKDALKINGIREIVAKISLSRANETKVSSVVIYNEGNFDDDMAGVRAIQLQDAKGAVLGSGMFFGWAGPMACL